MLSQYHPVVLYYSIATSDSQQWVPQESLPLGEAVRPKDRVPLSPAARGGVGDWSCPACVSRFCFIPVDFYLMTCDYPLA